MVFRATVIEQRDVWYADEGHLIKVFCEDESDPGDSDPIIPTDCKACDEAKYELTFEGLWSRHTHPKDFPDNGWLTKFSDVIGASHTSEKNFWVHGEPASEGLKELVEQGTTGVLESELKEEVCVLTSLLINLIFKILATFMTGRTYQNNHQSSRNFISKRDGENFRCVSCRCRASFGFTCINDLSLARLVRGHKWI